MRNRLICISIILLSFVAQLGAMISLNQLPTVYSSSGLVSFDYSAEGCRVTATGHEFVKLTVVATSESAMYYDEDSWDWVYYEGGEEHYSSSGYGSANVMVPCAGAVQDCVYSVEFYDYNMYFEETEEGSFGVLPSLSEEYMNKPVQFVKCARGRGGENTITLLTNYSVDAYPEYALITPDQFRYGVVLSRDGVENPFGLMSGCVLEIPENGTGGVTYNVSAVNRLEFWWNGKCVATLDSDPTDYSIFIHERLWKHFVESRDWERSLIYDVCVIGQGEAGSRTDHVEVKAIDDWDSHEGFVTIPDSATVFYYRYPVDAENASWGIYLPESSLWAKLMASASPLDPIDVSDVSPVTVIQSGAFQDEKQLTGVQIGANVSFIGDKAFAGCTNLDTIRCMSMVPPVMEYVTCFDCYETATLLVPEAALEAYKTADWWRMFKHINGVETPGAPGDINGDGEVGLSDVNALIDKILSSDDYVDVFDVNGDGEISVSDVNVLISIILAGG